MLFGAGYSQANSIFVRCRCTGTPTETQTHHDARGRGQSGHLFSQGDSYEYGTRTRTRLVQLLVLAHVKMYLTTGIGTRITVPHRRANCAGTSTSTSFRIQTR
eukprot:scaffold254151_cov38-Prasinocladus_malaysianus.AAC.1